MIWLVACSAPPPPLDLLEAAPAWPPPCTDVFLAPLPQPTAPLGNGWSGAPGQVVRPDGAIVALPGTPLALTVHDRTAWVAMGHAGAAAIDGLSARRLGIEGELVAVEVIAGAVRFADRRGRYVYADGREALLAGWPEAAAADPPARLPQEVAFTPREALPGVAVDRNGVLTAGGLRVHLDGAVGGAALRTAGEGAVWAPLPWVGAQRVDLHTGERRTWRFAPGALDVVDGEPAIAARGDFGVARLWADGRVEVCHPGQPVEALRRGADGIEGRTGAAWQRLGSW